MLRHIGQKRNYKHNIRLAILLCMTAGIVNTAGFLSFNVLTTNVTGHVALLAQRIARGDVEAASTVVFWLALFLAGAFFSGVCIRWTGTDKVYSYTLPIVIEITLLVVVSYLGITQSSYGINTGYFVGCLLFAMGLQNALVSAISGSVVRTTHLTGMFTDLGIDLSELISHRMPSKEKIKKRVVLRLVIILSFIIGGIIGGLVFADLQYYTFLLPAAILILALFYDVFRIRIRKVFHKYVLLRNISKNKKKVVQPKRLA